MRVNNRTIAGALCLLACAGGTALAAPLYSENFEVDPTANWTANKGPATTDSAVNYFFDYSSVGVPSAPNSSGTTRGLKMQANQSSGVFGGMSTSPNGQSFAGDYKVRFDWWTNFNGPAPLGGSGSTQLSTFGIDTAGTTAQWPGGVQDSIWFGGTTDGQSAQDWRAYSPTAPTSYVPASGVYAAGTGTSPDARNNSHPYYAGFGLVAAPAAQTLLYPQQTGTSAVGTAPFEWHDVVISKSGGSVTWTVDGLLIATVPAAHDTVAAGNNIFFGHSDTNATSSSDVNDVNLLFTLIDNVVVEAIPEPSSFALWGLSLLGLAGVRRRA